MITDIRLTLRQAITMAAAVIVLTLTGIFEAFSQSEVIPEALSLSNVLLAVILAGTGYYLAGRMREKGLLVAVLHGAIGAGVVTLAIVLLIMFQYTAETRFTQADLEPAFDMSFYFRNLDPLLGSSLTFGSENLAEAAGLLLAFSAVAGFLGAAAVFAPPKPRMIVFSTSGLVIILAVLDRQLDGIIALPDALTILLVFGAAYLLSWRVALPQGRVWAHLLLGLGVGILLSGVLLLLTNAAGLDRGSVMRGTGSKPFILELAIETPVVFMVGVSLTGAAGALAVHSGLFFHNAMVALLTGLVAFGLLNWQDAVTPLLIVLLAIIFSAVMWFMPRMGNNSSSRFNTLPQPEQRRVRGLGFATFIAIMLILPVFAGSSITSTFVLVMLYITMGIGLNVMVGYAGLLDLGYVASYAIGAYTAGVLTTPSLVTCGGLNPDEVRALVGGGQSLMDVCSGMMTFWQAWPLAVIVAGLTGMLLGIPVLRLRGDYLAIVTLGFGQIINRLINSDAFKELLGGPQGISGIPNAVVDLRGIGLGVYELVGAEGYYYLYLFSVLVAVFVVTRLINTRLGRAWRALRADEDVAEAMGINLVQTKLLAFGLSSAFAGLGGAVFGAWLRSIFPNSFELAVSINVLALIIIGGMGSVPGVIIGAFVLVGIPELLRELTDYRLLAFGILLVVVMLLRPEGLLPPQPPRLTELLDDPGDTPGGQPAASKGGLS